MKPTCDSGEPLALTPQGCMVPARLCEQCMDLGLGCTGRWFVSLRFFYPHEVMREAVAQEAP